MVKNNKYIFEITLKQFEVLEDVLSEIQEYREYEGDDLDSLNKLKEMFSYSKYIELRDENN